MRVSAPALKAERPAAVACATTSSRAFTAAPALSPAAVSANAVGWHLVGALVYALASVLLLAVGPVALSALGPSWLGWLVWPFALFTG